LKLLAPVGLLGEKYNPTSAKSCNSISKFSGAWTQQSGGLPSLSAYFGSNPNIANSKEE
jgi:hypothetical protein